MEIKNILTGKRPWKSLVQGTIMPITTLNDCYKEYFWGNLIIVDGDKRQLDLIINGDNYEKED